MGLEKRYLAYFEPKSAKITAIVKIVQIGENGLFVLYLP